MVQHKDKTRSPLRVNDRKDWRIGRRTVATVLVAGSALSLLFIGMQEDEKRRIQADKAKVVECSVDLAKLALGSDRPVDTTELPKPCNDRLFPFSAAATSAKEYGHGVVSTETVYHFVSANALEAEYTAQIDSRVRSPTSEILYDGAAALLVLGIVGVAATLEMDMAANKRRMASIR